MNAVVTAAALQELHVDCRRIAVAGGRMNVDDLETVYHVPVVRPMPWSVGQLPKLGWRSCACVPCPWSWPVLLGARVWVG